MRLDTTKVISKPKFLNQKKNSYLASFFMDYSSTLCSASYWLGNFYLSFRYHDELQEYLYSQTAKVIIQWMKKVQSSNYGKLTKFNVYTGEGENNFNKSL